MAFNPEKHHRRSIRMEGYDYSQAGVYFVTVCVKDRECLLGEIGGGKMVLNEMGKIVEETWNDLTNHIENIELDEFMVMPNHVHGIVVIKSEKKTESRKRHGLSEIVRQFKTFSAKRINQIRHSPGNSLWHRNYYEHIIRGRVEWNQLREYIANNPMHWPLDPENPSV